MLGTNRWEIIYFIFCVHSETSPDKEMSYINLANYLAINQSYISQKPGGRIQARTINQKRDFQSLTNPSFQIQHKDDRTVSFIDRTGFRQHCGGTGDHWDGDQHNQL